MSANFFHSFPQSIFEPFQITSPVTTRYNCIAWAFDDDTKWYWPDPTKLYYWPSNIPREETIDAFKKLYELKKYSVCTDGNYEVGYEKIAIYTLNNKPTHAARQITQTEWTSKLGKFEDVSHSLSAMQNGAYGNATVFMKRKTTPSH